MSAMDQTCEPTAPFEIWVSPDHIIHTRLNGFWAVDDAEHYFEQFGRQVTEERRGRSFARALVDLRNFAVQAADVSQRLRELDEALAREDDRIAIVVGSNLLKLQIERNRPRGRIAVFLSPDEAQEWLKAPSLP